MNFNFNQEGQIRRATDILTDFLRQKGLQHTRQREKILNVFLSSGGHLSVEELYGLVKKKASGIGQTTVFRTLKLLCEADIAQEVHFGDKIARYEVKYGHAHHDHLVCVECGECIEAADPRIERLQDKLCEKYEFTPQRHKLEIFGICGKCNRKGVEEKKKR